MRIREVGIDRLFRDPKHILVQGISGCGKTNFMETLALDAFGNGKYKVIFFDFFKYECCQFGFPETGEMARIIRNNFFEEPRAYPHEVLMPFAVTTFDRKVGGKMVTGLPKHKDEIIEKAKAKGRGYTYWKPFKINFSKLNTSDLFVVLRMLTESGKVSLDFLHSSKRYKNIENLMKEVIRLASTHDLRIGFEGESTTAKIGKTEIYQAILRLLSNTQQSGVLCEKGNPFELDLDAIMRSDEITTFAFANLDTDDMKFMLFVSILRQIKDMRVRKKYKKELLLVFPELADVAPATSRISPEAVVGTYSALNIMQLFSRQSRILKITLLCDTQTPKDCNRTVLNNFGWVIMGAMQQTALRWINENIVRIPDIPYYKIPHLKPGVFCVLPMDERSYAYPFFAKPCKARHRRRGDNVRGWVASRKDIEVVTYKDDVKSSLQVTIGEKPKKVKKKRGIITPALVEIVCNKYREGGSERGVAKELKKSRQTIHKCLILGGLIEE